MKTINISQTLQALAQIQNMESGKVCVIRNGANGPFYNLQYRENGKPVSRYIPRDQVEDVIKNTANYKQFLGLVDDYAQQIIQRTRDDRTSGSKKKKHRRSANCKTKSCSN